MTDSNDALAQLGRLKRHLDAALTGPDVERLVRGAAELRQRRRTRRTLAAGLVLGAAATVAIASVLRFSGVGNGTVRAPLPPQSSVAAPHASSSPEALERVELRDESRAISLEPGTRVAVEEDSPERAQLRLDRGRARFEVTRRPERPFSVRAGGVTVTVIGTIFGVELVADRVGVSVEEGSVEVDWGLGQKRLLAGQRGWFPPLVVTGTQEVAAPDLSGGSGKPATSAESRAIPPEAPGAKELLSEVDAVRSQGQPERAVTLLRQILREHPSDPRAPLAAFTLGRLLLNELGRPREAAAAFQIVRQKAPASQFAEDALAREVEAWERASEHERARARALSYLEQYPAGRHVRQVKALARLE
jgi:transmembrane sensor